MNTSEQPEWQRQFQDWLTQIASAADDAADAGIRKLKKRLGHSGIPKIQPYLGYANSETARIHGRVLTNPPVDTDLDNADWWQNFSNTVKRFASDEVPGVQVEANVDGSRSRATSDPEGYFRVAVPSSLPDDVFWTRASLRIVDPQQVRRQHDQTTCGILNVPREARFAIISDVDDTILHTGATDIATMARLTFFGNARTRAPLEGVAELYEQLQNSAEGEPTNPIFYVSSSPWNLYDLLQDFMELNAIPRGPLLLRDLGFDPDKFLKTGHDHKLTKARRLIDDFEHLPFILFGDSGQEDARLYAAAAADYPNRIRAIFIRDTDPEVTSEHDEKVDHYAREAAEVGVPMYLVKDSIEVATIATEQGWLTPDQQEQVVIATKRDKQRTAGVMQP